VSEQDKGFTQGVAICVAEIVRLYDEPTMAEEIALMAGLNLSLCRKAGVQEFDLKELRKVIK
jgi:hypothetical protein